MTTSAGIISPANISGLDLERPASDVGPRIPPSAAVRTDRVAKAITKAQAGANTPEAKVVKPTADSSINAQGKGSSKVVPYSQRMGKTQNRGKAVGGPVQFSIGILKQGTANVPQVDKNYPEVVFEMAPARQSMYDKQGQRVPGASAGMSMRLKANVARHTVPGSKPALQHMGIAEEVMDWVGAMLGFEHFETKREDGSKRRTAAEEAQELMEQFKRKREVILTLRWTESHHEVEFGPGIRFTGYIKDIRQIEAHENKFYYMISLAVSNRQDIKLGSVKDTEPPFVLPNASSLEEAPITPAVFVRGVSTANNTFELFRPGMVQVAPGATKEEHDTNLTMLKSLALDRQPDQTQQEFLQGSTRRGAEGTETYRYYNDLTKVEQFLQENPSYKQDPTINGMLSTSRNKLSAGVQLSNLDKTGNAEAVFNRVGLTKGKKK